MSFLRKKRYDSYCPSTDHTVTVCIVSLRYAAYCGGMIRTTTVRCVLCLCVCSILRSTGYALQTPQPIRIIPPQYAAYRNDTMHTVAVRSYWGSTIRTVTVRCVLCPVFFSPRFWLQKTLTSIRIIPQRYAAYRTDTIHTVAVRSYCEVYHPHLSPWGSKIPLSVI